MSKKLVICIVLLLPVVATPQTAPKRDYLERGLIHHDQTTSTVLANSAHPLHQAIIALREEYGWLIDIEAAPTYSSFDRIDDTDPKWRASHPNEKGVTGQAGGEFSSDYSEQQAMSHDRAVLEKIVHDYNTTGYPGKYVVRTRKEEHFLIVGEQVRGENGVLHTIRPLLDTPITVDIADRNAAEALQEITRALHGAVGKEILFFFLPTNTLLQTTTRIGGQNVPARDLLEATLAATKRPLVYGVGYDPDASVYLMSIYVAVKASENRLGQRVLTPVDRVPRQ